MVLKRPGKAGKALASSSCAGEKVAVRLRTWDYNATRAIKIKLGQLPKTQIANNKDAKGQSLHSRVLAELQRLKPLGKHIGLDFWHQLIVEHNLVGGFASELPPPPASEVVDKELNLALSLCHDRNPAARSTAKLLRWMSYAAPPNRTELIGLLSGAGEGPSLSKAHSLQICEGLIKYIARVKANETYCDLWELVKDHFDSLLVSLWQKSQSKGMTRAQYLRTWRAELQMYFTMSDAVELNAAAEDDNEAGIDNGKLDNLMSKSVIGSELFAKERGTVDLREYIQEIQRRLRELEHQDFSASEVGAFRTLMAAHAGSLEESVWEHCSRDKITFTFLNAVLKQKQVHPNDHWSFRLAASSKTIAISNGGLKRTIWERWLYGESTPLPNVPQHTKVCETLIFDAGNAREWLGKKMVSCTSSESAKTIVKNNLEELVKMDEFFWQEASFLEEFYDQMMEEKMRNLMLEVTPAIGERRVLAKAVVAARALSVGPTCCAQKKSIQDDMMNAANALLDISTSSSPTSKELASMSMWMNVFHKRCENFQHVVMDAEYFGRCIKAAPGAQVPRSRNLYGADALKYRFERCNKAALGAQDDQDLKELRQFKWMMSDKEGKALESWTAAKIVSSKDKIMNRQKALQNVEKNMAKDKRAMGDEPSQMAVMAPPLKKAAATEEPRLFEDLAVNEEDPRLFEDCFEDIVADTGVLNFFGARAL